MNNLVFETNRDDIFISIIVVSYYSSEDVSRLLTSLLAFEDDLSFFEIIIVDNARETELREYINRIQKLFVTYVESENRGFSFANNLGAKISRGEVLLFLNPDTYLFEPLLKNLYISVKENEDYSAFILNQVNKKLKRQLSYYFYDSHGLINSFLVKFFNSISLYLEPYMYGSGAALGVNKKIYIDLGGFDENIFLYYEEPDFFKRLVANGFRSKFLSSAKIVHLGGTSTSSPISVTKWTLHSGKYYYSKYNLDFSKNLTDRLNYNRFKYLFHKLFLNKIKADEILVLNKIIKFELDDFKKKI